MYENCLRDWVRFGLRSFGCPVSTMLPHLEPSDSAVKVILTELPKSRGLSDGTKKVGMARVAGYSRDIRQWAYLG